jgi:hypothetical protein
MLSDTGLAASSPALPGLLFLASGADTVPTPDTDIPLCLAWHLLGVCGETVPYLPRAVPLYVNGILWEILGPVPRKTESSS